MALSNSTLPLNELYYIYVNRQDKSTAKNTLTLQKLSLIRDFINLLIAEPMNDKVCLQNAFALVDKVYNEVKILKDKFVASDFLTQLDHVAAN